MRVVIQRVKKASVNVAGSTVGAINQGILVLFGVHKGDTLEDIPWLAKKITELRIFQDEDKKMNRSVQDIQGQLLIVSQFTLYGDCSKGRRPGFSDALPGAEAENLYNAFVEEMQHYLGEVQTGVFGAEMEVSLINDGPVTFIIDSKKNSN